MLIARVQQNSLFCNFNLASIQDCASQNYIFGLYRQVFVSSKFPKERKNERKKNVSKM